MLNKRTLPALWLLACVGTPALAASSCDEIFASPGAPAQLLPQVLALEPQCQRQALFLYQLGRLLNQMGRYDEALDRLEGAILRQPDHWQSQLEYAIALEGVGDTESAAGLLTNLAQNPALDADTQRQIATLRQRSSNTQRRSQRTVIGLATGFDDNLMGSTQQQQFDLTLPTGRLPVTTDAEQRPRAGKFARVDVRHDGDFAGSEAAQWRYSLVGSYRQSPDYTPANLGQLGALIERDAIGPQGLYLLGLHQLLLRAESTVLRQTQFGMGLAHTTTVWGHTCQQRLGLDLQHLAYPASSELDGRYTGLLGQAYCPASGLQMQLRLGQDRPTQADRPGGSQNQYGLRIAKTNQLGAAQLAVELDHTHQADQAGYSTLLENNAPRQINRTAYRFEYRWVAGTLSPYVGFEWINQQSNLPLFDVQNRVLTAGMRVKW